MPASLLEGTNLKSPQTRHPQSSPRFALSPAPANDPPRTAAEDRRHGSNRKKPRSRRCAESARRSGARPAHAYQTHERQRRRDDCLDYTRHAPCASGCMSTRTSLEKRIKFHGFPGFFPVQLFTGARRHREAVVTANQRMLIRCHRNDLASFVHDVSHAPFFGGRRAASLIWIM
jgi:hypothetical protein